MTAEIIIDANSEEILGGSERSPLLRLSLDESGTAHLYSSDRHSSENSTPADVWHRRTLEWSHVLSQGSMVIADPDAISDLANRLAPLLARVHAGHETVWDGSNMVGRLTDDAQEASDDIERIIDDAEWTDGDIAVWSAGEWIYEARKEGITAETTDEEIERIAARDEKWARNDGVRLLGSTAEARRQYRDELRLEAEEG